MAKKVTTSRALAVWKSDRSLALDEFEEIHKSLASKTSGIRIARLQINQAYALMLSGQFQGFCRDLHIEAIDHFSGLIQPQPLEGVIQLLMKEGRKLDSGNPNPGNLGSDFNRFGLKFWDEVLAYSPSMKGHKIELEVFNGYRNEIAHQKFNLGKPIAITHSQVKAWRKSCDVLATAFDATLGSHLMKMTSIAPW
jgi:hypothetical protein